MLGGVCMLMLQENYNPALIVPIISSGIVSSVAQKTLELPLNYSVFDRYRPCVELFKSFIDFHHPVLSEHLIGLNSSKRSVNI